MTDWCKRKTIALNLPEFPWTVYIYFNGINCLLWSVRSTPHLKKQRLGHTELDQYNLQYTNIMHVSNSFINPFIYPNCPPKCPSSIHYCNPSIYHPFMYPSSISYFNQYIIHPSIHPSRHQSINQSINPTTHPSTTWAKFKKKSWLWERSMPGSDGSSPCSST